MSDVSGPEPSALGPPPHLGASEPPDGGEKPNFVTRYALAQKAGGIVVPLLTVFLAFLIGGVVVLITTGSNPISTYKAIFEGAGLNWFTEVGSYEIRVPFTDAHVWFPWNVNDIESTAAFNLQQTLILTATLILTGFAVSFAFKCGLFNIGGQGQYIVGAIEFVHRRLVEERDEGRAILLVSLELEEILSLSDRILVIFEGRIVGEFPPGVSEEELGVAMTGGGRKAA